MNLPRLIACVFSIVLASRALAASTPQERPDWATFFSDADAHGTIVVVDARSKNDTVFVVDAQRASRR